MASTFQWGIDHGAQGGTPTRGTPTTGVLNCSFKSIDDSTTAFPNAVITAGANSFERFHWGMWSGAGVNQINTVKINHVSGVFNAGISLKFQTGSANASNWYTTPSATTNANLIQDLTNTGSASVSGIAVMIGDSGAWGGSKTSSFSTIPCWSQYLTFQLVSTAGTNAGNVSSPNYALQLSWNEN